MRAIFRTLIACVLSLALSPDESARAGEPVALATERAQLEQMWAARIQGVLDRGDIPVIDLQSSLKRKHGRKYLSDAIAAMDELGVALIAFDGYEEGAGVGGYAWGYYIHEVANAHPDRFIVATNGGTNGDWTDGNDDFLGQTEDHVRTGVYPIMGEFEFRHYMSAHQCKKGRTERDVSLPLDGPNGERLFRLSAETGVAFVIHLEMEDERVDELETMLGRHPDAKVIVAHFGQIRHPDKQSRFGPELVRRLMERHPNLHFDLATGQPGRRYKCNGKILDTVIWQDIDHKTQRDELKPAYREILADFSSRFVFGSDYGGGRGELAEHLARKVANLRLILRDLPETAKHDIAYKNAWRLLTGCEWKGAPASGTSAAPETAALKQDGEVRYDGPIADGHSHLDGESSEPDGLIAAMDLNGVEIMLTMPKQAAGWEDEDALDFAARHAGRIVPAIGFQHKGWRKAKASFMRDVEAKLASGRYGWMGEVAFRGKVGGKLHASPDDPRWLRLLELSAETGVPLTVHHNPYEFSGGVWKRTAEFEAFTATLDHNPRAAVVWAHWCGLSSPKTIGELLSRFSSLHCDLAWITKDQSTLPRPLVDERGNFEKGWVELIEAFPERFLAGVDVGGKAKQLRKYDGHLGLIRKALGGLSPETAAKVAGGNFRRLASGYLTR